MVSLHKSRGFTLVELIIVILVIGILAAIVAPKFIGISASAKVASEDNIAGALNSAIRIKTSENIVNGTKNSFENYYPDVNPLTLLAQAPPNLEVANGPVTPDGIHWRAYHYAPYGAWLIMCPHYKGNNCWAGSGYTQGSFYIYQYGSAINPGTGGSVWGHQPGDFWRYDDRGGH